MNRKLVVAALILLLIISGICFILTLPLRVKYQESSCTSGGTCSELNTTYTVINWQIISFDGNYVVSWRDYSIERGGTTLTRSGNCTKEEFNSDRSLYCTPAKRIMSLLDVQTLNGEFKGRPSGKWEITIG